MTRTANHAGQIVINVLLAPIWNLWFHEALPAMASRLVITCLMTAVFVEVRRHFFNSPASLDQKRP